MSSNSDDSKPYYLNSEATGWQHRAAIVAAWYAVSKVVGAVSGVVMAAARYETLGVVMRIVGNNAGYTGKQMEEFAKGLQKSGIAMTESRQVLTVMKPGTNRPE